MKIIIFSYVYVLSWTHPILLNSMLHIILTTVS